MASLLQSAVTGHFHYHLLLYNTFVTALLLQDVFISLQYVIIIKSKVKVGEEK